MKISQSFQPRSQYGAYYQNRSFQRSTCLHLIPILNLFPLPVRTWATFPPRDLSARRESRGCTSAPASAWGVRLIWNRTHRSSPFIAPAF